MFSLYVYILCELIDNHAPERVYLLLSSGVFSALSACPDTKLVPNQSLCEKKRACKRASKCNRQARSTHHLKHATAQIFPEQGSSLRHLRRYYSSSL